MKKKNPSTNDAPRTVDVDIYNPFDYEDGYIRNKM